MCQPNWLFTGVSVISPFFRPVMALLELRHVGVGLGEVEVAAVGAGTGSLLCFLARSSNLAPA